MKRFLLKRRAFFYYYERVDDLRHDAPDHDSFKLRLNFNPHTYDDNIAQICEIIEACDFLSIIYQFKHTKTECVENTLADLHQEASFLDDLERNPELDLNTALEKLKTLDEKKYWSLIYREWLDTSPDERPQLLATLRKKIAAEIVTTSRFANSSQFTLYIEEFTLPSQVALFAGLLEARFEDSGIKSAQHPADTDIFLSPIVSLRVDYDDTGEYVSAITQYAQVLNATFMTSAEFKTLQLGVKETPQLKKLLFEYVKRYIDREQGSHTSVADDIFKRWPDLAQIPLILNIWYRNQKKDRLIVALGIIAPNEARKEIASQLLIAMQNNDPEIFFRCFKVLIRIEPNSLLLQGITELITGRSFVLSEFNEQNVAKIFLQAMRNKDKVVDYINNIWYEEQSQSIPQPYQPKGT